jgi:hypothetical protein
MKDRLHGEISTELDQTTKTDKTTVIIAIILNLVFMFANMAFAAGVFSVNYDYRDPTTVVTSNQFNFNMFGAFAILIVVTIIFNIIVIQALSRGVERRTKLTQGLVKMYQEEGLDKYYDSSIIEGYKARYSLYKNIVMILGLLAITIPLVFLGV